MSFIRLCEDYLGRYGGRAFLTPSCTSALELSVILSGVGPGDEVIIPSFTFSSCANAVIARGATPVFVDIRLDTLNIDPWEAGNARTPRTRAIMPVHYAGVSPDMERIQAIVDFETGDYPILIIEDAAQTVGNFTLTGDFACMSFHKTKNASCGQGGALFVRDPALFERADIVRNCGTTIASKKDWDWVEFGTKGLMGEQTAEVLWRSLRDVESVNANRIRIWQIYRDGIRAEEKASSCGNGHIFWFLTEDRDRKMARLNERGIRAVKHYTPLHNRVPGIRYGRTLGCPNAEYVSARILRPPMDVTEERALEIVTEINRSLYENESPKPRRGSRYEAHHEGV